MARVNFTIALLGYKQQSMVTRSLFYEGHFFTKRFLMAQTFLKGSREVINLVVKSNAIKSCFYTVFKDGIALHTKVKLCFKIDLFYNITKFV